MKTHNVDMPKKLRWQQKIQKFTFTKHAVANKNMYVHTVTFSSKPNCFVCRIKIYSDLFEVHRPVQKHDLLGRGNHINLLLSIPCLAVMSCKTNGRLVTIPDPRGKKSLSTANKVIKFSQILILDIVIIILRGTGYRAAYRLWCSQLSALVHHNVSGLPILVNLSTFL